MPRINDTVIYSIFEQVEEAAAEHLLKNGKGRKIPLTQFPSILEAYEAWYNELGQKAKFAIYLKKEEAVEFNELVANLRA